MRLLLQFVFDKGILIKKRPSEKGGIDVINQEVLNWRLTLI
ncbi:hypothetical protein AB7078_13185 [Proteus mirabilis]